MIFVLAVLLVGGIAMFIAMGDAIFGKNTRTLTQLEKDTKKAYQERVQELGVDLKKATKVRRFSSIGFVKDGGEDYYVWRENDKLALLRGLKTHYQTMSMYISYELAEKVNIEYIPISEIKKIHTVGSNCVLDTTIRHNERLVFLDSDYYSINRLITSNESSGITTIKKEEPKQKNTTDVSEIMYADRIKALGLDVNKAIKVTKYDRIGDPQPGTVYYMWWAINKLALFIANEPSNKSLINSLNGNINAEYYTQEEIKAIQIIGNNCVIDITKKIYNNRKERLIFKKEDLEPIKALLSEHGVNIIE